MEEVGSAEARFIAALPMAAHIGEEASTAGVGGIRLTAAGVGDARTATRIVIGAGDIPASMDMAIRIHGGDGLEVSAGTVTATRTSPKPIRTMFTSIPITQAP